MQTRMEPRPKVGDAVVFHDPVGLAHNAIITAAWDQPTSIAQPCVNLVFVSSDADKQDSYGRQTERRTSVGHKDTYAVHGNYWRWPNESVNPVVQPSST